MPSSELSPIEGVQGGAAATEDVEVTDAKILMALAGPGATRIAPLERVFGVSATVRGQTISLKGELEAVRNAERALAELIDVAQRNLGLSEGDVDRSLRALRDNPTLKLRELFQNVVLTAARGKHVAPKGMAQRAYIHAIRDHDVVFGVGPAGTGKTYLAMAMAVNALQEQRVRRIILTRPAVEAGEKLGFLPGDLAEKVNPYLRPLYDALHDMMDFEKAQALITRGAIEVAPLAFMRGRTLNDSFVILDEAQNTTVPQMKMFLTRLGMRSKSVITGDITQVDLPQGKLSGLRDALCLLEGVDGIAIRFFTKQDVVRHPLVQRIVEAYETREAAAEEAAARAAQEGASREISETAEQETGAARASNGFGESEAEAGPDAP
jgi:phosphate starvation-inducible PhoH-like protein